MNHKLKARRLKGLENASKWDDAFFLLGEYFEGVFEKNRKNKQCDDLKKRVSNKKHSQSEYKINVND